LFIFIQLLLGPLNDASDARAMITGMIMP
jgi:hypothetical protein